MGAPESATSQDAALSNLLSAAIGSPETSVPVSSTQPEQQAHDAPAAVAQRIEQYIGRYGRENTATLLLYEAMKALRTSAPSAAGDAQDAARYRIWRDAMLCEDPKFLRAMADGMPEAVGAWRRPTAAEWDSGVDAAIAAQQGEGNMQ